MKRKFRGWLSIIEMFYLFYYKFNIFYEFKTTLKPKPTLDAMTKFTWFIFIKSALLGV